MLEQLKNLYTESVQTQLASAEQLTQTIVKVAEELTGCLLRGNKIIVCGHGKSYANAQFLVANLLNRYAIERPSFPAILLSIDSAVGSAIIADNHYNRLYQHQFNAVAQKGDTLIILSPFGEEETILNVVDCALNKDIQIIALNSTGNDHLQGLLTEKDLEIPVPSNKESRILESHLFIINALCELIDQLLFSH